MKIKSIQFVAVLFGFTQLSANLMAAPEKSRVRLDTKIEYGVSACERGEEVGTSLWGTMILPTSQSTFNMIKLPLSEMHEFKLVRAPADWLEKEKGAYLTIMASQAFKKDRETLDPETVEIELDFNFNGRSSQSKIRRNIFKNPGESLQAGVSCKDTGGFVSLDLKVHPLRFEGESDSGTKRFQEYIAPK